MAGCDERCHGGGHERYQLATKGITSQRKVSSCNESRFVFLFGGGGCRAALRHLGPAHLECPGPGPESPLRGGDFADPQQAESRWSFLNRCLASSRPWLLQEAGGILSQDVTSHLESRELLPVLPYISPGVETPPLAPILFSPGANGPPLEASATPSLSLGAALSLLACPRAGGRGRKRSAAISALVALRERRCPEGVHLL